MPNDADDEQSYWEIPPQDEKDERPTPQKRKDNENDCQAQPKSKLRKISHFFSKIQPHQPKNEEICKYEEPPLPPPTKDDDPTDTDRDAEEIYRTEESPLPPPSKEDDNSREGVFPGPTVTAIRWDGFPSHSAEEIYRTEESPLPPPSKEDDISREGVFPGPTDTGNVIRWDGFPSHSAEIIYKSEESPIPPPSKEDENPREGVSQGPTNTDRDGNAIGRDGFPNHSAGEIYRSEDPPLPPQSKEDKNLREGVFPGPTNTDRDEISREGVFPGPTDTAHPPPKTPKLDMASRPEEIYKNETDIPPQEVPTTLNLPDEKITDWPKIFADHLQRLREEENVKKMRLEKKNLLEKSWELAKLCREFIRENSKKWAGELEERRKKREKEIAKEERKQIASEKKEKTLTRLVQKKIQTCMQNLSESDRNKIKMQEDKRRKVELKEMKENLWKRREVMKKKDHRREDLTRQALEEKLRTLEEKILERKREYTCFEKFSIPEA